MTRFMIVLYFSSAYCFSPGEETSFSKNRFILSQAVVQFSFNTILSSMSSPLKFKHDVEHSVSADGITYRVAKTEEDVQAAIDLFYKVVIPGTCFL